MIRKIYYALRGSISFSFPAADRARVLDHCLREGIGAISCTVSGEEGRLRLLKRDACRLPESLGCCQIGEQGLPMLVRRACDRPGLVIGAVLGLLLLLLSSLTVWRVEIRGNERIGATEIEEALSAAGLSVGDLTVATDIASVKTRFLRENPEISWIGIYLRGTTAAIEVRERENGGIGGTEDGLPLSNLVAATDAVIESIYAERGRAAVSEGMTVKRGDLLISGIYRTAEGLACVRAEGVVRGRVTRDFQVVQPLRAVRKEYTSRKASAFSVNFFGKEIKLFKIAGKSEEEYDIIKRKEQVVLFGALRLPIYFSREYRLSYVERELILTENEAVKAAYASLHAELASALADSELLRKRLEGELTEEGYCLRCHTEYLTDIAVPLAYETE